MKILRGVAWIVIVAVVLATGAGGYLYWTLVARPVSLASLLDYPGKHLDEQMIVAADGCVQRDLVLGHPAWLLTAGDRQAVYLGPEAPTRVGDHWVAQVSVEQIEVLGQSDVVLVHASEVGDFATKLKRLVARGSRGQVAEATPVQGAPFSRTGAVEAVYEAFGVHAVAVETDEGTVHAFTRGYTPPRQAVVLITGTSKTVLAGTDYATQVVEAEEVSIPIAELSRHPAVYQDQPVRVAGTVTMSCSVLGRSVFGVEDCSGDVIEVWSDTAGYRPGTQVAVEGRLQHVAGWGGRQVVFLVQEPDSEAELQRPEQPSDAAECEVAPPADEVLSTEQESAAEQSDPEPEDAAEPAPVDEQTGCVGAAEGQPEPDDGIDAK